MLLTRAPVSLLKSRELDFLLEERKQKMGNFLDTLKKNRLQVIISVGAIILAALHLFVPGFKIDTIGMSLIFLAMFPWIIPFLQRFLESGKLGNIELKFKDIERKIETQDKRMEQFKISASLKNLKYELDAFNPDAPINGFQTNRRHEGLQQNPFLVYVEPTIKELLNSPNLAVVFNETNLEKLNGIITTPQYPIKELVKKLDEIIKAVG
jgi:hypothetical protein